MEYVKYIRDALECFSGRMWVEALWVWHKYFQSVLWSPISRLLYLHFAPLSPLSLPCSQCGPPSSKATKILANLIYECLGNLLLSCPVLIRANILSTGKFELSYLCAFFLQIFAKLTPFVCWGDSNRYNSIRCKTIRALFWELRKLSHVLLSCRFFQQIIYI